jgi:hypothetical protein
MKKMFFLMLLVASAGSMKGQEIPNGPKMVVTGNMVNTGALNAAIPVDLRTNAAGVGRIDNKANGDIKTPALNVNTKTLLNNEGNLCVGCEPAKPASKPCDGAIIYDAAWDYVSGSLPGDGAKVGGADDTTDQVWSPNIQADGTWNATALDSYFTKANVDLCVYKTNANSGNPTSWVNAVNNCANGTYADGDATLGWYLPNERELQSIYQAVGGDGWYAGNLEQLSIRSTGEIITSAENMVYSFYLSSTEWNRNTGTYFSFSDGRRTNGFKYRPDNARCVRRL